MLIDNFPKYIDTSKESIWHQPIVFMEYTIFYKESWPKNEWSESGLKN